MNSKIFSVKVRLEVIKMAYEAKAAHIASALSIVDILSVLYNDFLVYDYKNSNLIGRDRFILSKGHACSALYAVLGLKKFFDKKLLSLYSKDDSDFMAHISHKVPGVEFSTGSLGHGLPFGVGIAQALKLKKIKSKVYVLIGDGELAEGSNFESLLFAAHNNLDNLVLIVDNNNLQSLTTVDKTLNLFPYDKKFESFNWEYFECNGNSINSLQKIFKKILKSKNMKPKVVVAKTIKGKGVSFMENKVEWHYKPPNFEQFEKAIKEVKDA
jgi:transketolase